jgi:hypothetical protein
MPARAVAATIGGYIFLAISIVGNIVYFVYSTQTQLGDNWTRYGFAPALCFGFFVAGAVCAFRLHDDKLPHQIRYHTANQQRIVFILLIGGIFSAVQTSAQWLLESNFLSGIVDVLLILIVIYVSGRLVIGLVRLWMLWITDQAMHGASE